MFQQHHFLVIAYPVQGHLNPALQLSKRLVSLGARVTLSTTLHMHRRITNIPILPGLSFLPFSDGHDDGFNPANEAQYSLYLSDLKRHGSHFLTNLILSTSQHPHPFTCVIYTILQTWVPQVARALHLPTALLWTQPATVFNIFYQYFNGYKDYVNDKAKQQQEEALIELPGLSSPLSARDLPAYLLPSDSKFHSTFAPMFEAQFRELDNNNNTNPNPTRVLVNTFEALESEALRAVDDKCIMVPIGPLIPSAYLDGKDPNDTSFGGDVYHPSNGYIEWLDSKPDMSVVYVSFGSVCVLSKIQMEEIARALLDCGRPFLWVVRENIGNDNKLLDDGLITELEGKEGKIVKWCCQLEVLSHGSLGCFVTHCGWNSTMESLVCGVPVVAFPQWVEQKTNAKLIEDVWKTGVRVDRMVNEDGVVEAEHITRCLDVLMGNNDEFRTNAIKWKCLATDAVNQSGSSEINLRAFLHLLGR